LRGSSHQRSQPCPTRTKARCSVGSGCPHADDPPTNPRRWRTATCLSSARQGRCASATRRCRRRSRYTRVCACAPGYPYVFAYVFVRAHRYPCVYLRARPQVLIHMCVCARPPGMFVYVYAHSHSPHHAERAHYSLLTTHYSLLTTHYSLLTFTTSCGTSSCRAVSHHSSLNTAHEFQ